MSLNSIVTVPVGSSPMPRLSAQPASRAGASGHAIRRARPAPEACRQTVIAIEQGRYSPSLEMAFQIARVFRVPLDEVFQYPDGEGEPH
jgi:transcriptional regulator with XRE-family HTH domain